MAKILIVEDERSLLKGLRFNLEREGYKVATATDGQAGLEAFGREKPDLVILDVMLPKVDGYGVCRAIRQKSQTPILMLTARGEEIDRVLGLELGADDYVTKPFSLRELLARVKAILKRVGPAARPAALRAGPLELDLERYEAKCSGRAVHLSSKEFDLLRCFMEADGKALTREQILERVWGYDKGLELDTRTVDQHVLRLRERLGPEAPRLVTVKNVGYRLKAD
ncbi:MAG: response regulator transcription factor [Elusimicrobia bacterium]|nr:response regulator transcription factor [Elusimicrobiota bacterium]